MPSAYPIGIVAVTVFLLALKVLSERDGREQDTLDIKALLQESSDIDVAKAKELYRKAAAQG